VIFSSLLILLHFHRNTSQSVCYRTVIVTVVATKKVICQPFTDSPICHPSVKE